MAGSSQGYNSEDFTDLQPSFSMGYGIGENIPALCDLYLKEEGSARGSQEQTSGSYAAINKGTARYINVPLKDWQGVDCKEWALSVLKRYHIDEMSIDLRQLSTKCGQDLLPYTHSDFCRLVGNACGNIFYQEFQQLKAIQKEQNIPYAQEDLNEGVSYCDLDEWRASEEQATVTPSEYRDTAYNDNLVGGIRTLGFQDPYVPCNSYDADDSLLEEGSDEQQATSETLFKRIPSTRKSRKRGPKSWEFLYRLLMNPEYNPTLIRWEDRDTATFRLVRPEIIAQMWGARNNQPNLIYNNFARGLRYHYKTGVLIQVSDRQLVYRFGKPAFEYLKSTMR